MYDELDFDIDKYNRLQELKDKKKSKRTLEYLNELYIKSNIRNNKLLSKRRVIWEEIIDKISANEKGEKIVYYEENDKVFSLVFTKSNISNGWAFHHDTIEFNEADLKKNRGKKLNFLLTSSDPLAFKLGEKFRSSDLRLSRLSSIAFNYLNTAVSNKLNEIFEGEMVDDILTISIGDSKYYVENKNDYYHYINFNICGEVNESNEIIL